MDVSAQSLTAPAVYGGRARRRRALFLSATLATTGFAAGLMWNILRANGFTTFEWFALPLFSLLFAWIAGAFWTAVAGFAVRLAGGDPALPRVEQGHRGALRGRTALVMPIHEEDPARVIAGVAAIWRSLASHREARSFDFHLLSDTRSPDVAAAEEAGWRALVAELGAEGRIFYRRRLQPTGRKVGNIAEFVHARGSAYDYFVVLDADSIMSGEAIVSLARLMDDHPEVGIIQTLPFPVGRRTPFARVIQFAARLSSPMMASGLAFWQLGEANYWGHNAIIRMRPFATSCDLPKLPGRAPFGGEILSHDFVESAFMRRAGYSVWLIPEIAGSWEEIPSNVLDYAARDRRWAQGNLQHLRLLSLGGLHWMSRLHMLTGVMAYVSSLAWLALLMTSTMAACWHAANAHPFFEAGAYSLFPDWPDYRTPQVLSLLGVTAVVLLLPKVLSVILALADPALRRGFGGTLMLLRSVLGEQALSMLIAPTMMLFHASFVVATLLGRPVGWGSHERDDRRVGLPEAVDRHKWHVVIGAVWGGLLFLYAPAFLAWMLPVLAGLLSSATLTAVTSRPSDDSSRARLFVTPEETAAPPELAAVAAVMPRAA